MKTDPRILVTGAFGQIGSELVPALMAKFGSDNVYCLDLEIPPDFVGHAVKQDISDTPALRRVIEENHITDIYHLVSLLSARGEAEPDLAWSVNLGSLKAILDIAKELHIRLFWPSSIAAFGPTTPRVNTPQHTILEPGTMYGITKVAGELLCHYYFSKYGVDVRSLRYPGILSWKTPPGGGTTDYAVAIFAAAVKSGKYTCFLKSDTVLPMMYIDDAVSATLKLMAAPAEKITVRTSYNVSAVSFSPAELAAEISRRLPLTVDYSPDFRQQIADSWPDSIADAEARTDWGWQEEFNLTKLVDTMLAGFTSLYGKN